MALKVFVYPGGGSNDEFGEPIYAVGECPVMDSTTGFVYWQDVPENPVYLSAQVSVRYVDTVSSIKLKIQKALRDYFEEFTGRTDGEVLNFVWMDDKGLL